MADSSEPTEEELIFSIKEALKHSKSEFERRISNGHKLRDLDIPFNRLNKVAELAVKGNFGAIRERPKYKLGELYPMLQRCMIWAKCAINRRLSPRMSKVHPWMVIFDLPMAQEVFNILHKDVLGLTRYGLEVEEKPGSVTITFFSLRRLCHLFDKFMDCGGFIKLYPWRRKGTSQAHCQPRKKRSDDLQCKSRVFAKFFYGYWNSFGISQH